MLPKPMDFDVTKKLKLRFWAKVSPPDIGGCCEWVAALDRCGYGRIAIRRRGQTRPSLYKAHRVAWFLLHLELSQSVDVLHNCDNRRCVNPEHLFLGTQQENNLDMCSKGRQARGSRGGNSVLSEEHVRQIKERLRSGELPPAICSDFGVSRDTIYQIKWEQHLETCLIWKQENTRSCLRRLSR